MKVKLYMQNYGSQKEGNFCKTNRKKRLKLFFYNLKEKLMHFVSVVFISVILEII